MKGLTTLMAAAALAVLAGCATAVPTGAVYTGVNLPVSNSTGSVNYGKVGKAETRSLLGLFAWGDSSVNAAATQGKISKVQSVDYTADNFLGVYGKYTTTVYGD